MFRPARRGISTEMASIVLTLSVSALAFLFFKYMPNYTPGDSQNWIWGLPGWLSLGYITIQLWLLLDTALRVRAAGVIGAVLAIAPVMTGIVIGVLWTIGYLHALRVPAQCAGDADRDRHRGIRQHLMGAPRAPATRHDRGRSASHLIAQRLKTPTQSRDYRPATRQSRRFA